MSISTAAQQSAGGTPARWGSEPIRLAANQPPRPYRGGRGIARLRGELPVDDYRPEDFVGSTTEVYEGGGVGLSRLPDETLLRDAIGQAPELFLGAEHVGCCGADPALLVKLLDTGQRLFIHYHPTAAFAAEHLGQPRGKNEAWVVVEVSERSAAEDGGCAYVGFHRPVEAAELSGWVLRQDSGAMLAAMNRLALAAGDVLFVPAGVPHAIGRGLTLVELQEPSDLSILLEYQGFERVDPSAALLGLDLHTVTAGVDRRVFGPAEVTELLRRGVAAGPAGDRAVALLPAAAETYFRAELLAPDGSVPLDQGMGILIVLSGEGILGWPAGEITVATGDTLLLPYGMGPARLRGPVRAIRCRPPASR